jgi:hypothetical protein
MTKAVTAAPKTTKLSGIQVDTIAECNYVTEISYFDVRGIFGDGSKSDQQIDTITFDDGYTFKFNFCEADIADEDIPPQCANAGNAYAYGYTDTECFALRNGDPSTDSVDVLTESSRGVGLTYTNSGNDCLKVNLMCNSDASTPS